MWSSSVASQVTVALVAIALPTVMYRSRRYIRRAFYTIQAIKNRHEAFDDAVWEEKDAEVLLMKVVSKTSRSMGVTFMMWPERQYLGTLFAYIYFRVVDTLADDIVGVDGEIKALGMCKDRLDVLQQKNVSPGPFDVSEFEFLLDTPKQKSYKVIVEQLHRFDPIWFMLSDSDKKIVYDYCMQLIEGNVRLCTMNGTVRLQEECHTAIEIGLTYGFLPIFGLQDASDHIRDGVTKEGKAWKAWAMAICLGQLVSTIEEDLQENICFDDSLTGMMGENAKVDHDVVAKVRAKYLKRGLENYTKTLPFFHYDPIVKSVGLRLMFLQFTVVALNVYERELAKVGTMPQRKFNVWWVMLKSTIQSILSIEWYKESIQEEVKRAEKMLAVCPEPKE